jgi:hypothetical protein
MLKTYCKYHEGKHRIIIVENSDLGDNTRGMLERYNIPYVGGYKVLPPPPEEDNWGWSHHQGLDWAVRNCKTRYCLIVDTDIIFTCNILHLLDILKRDSSIVALGPHQKEHQKEQKTILPRIHPCFMFLDTIFFNSYSDLTFNGSLETIKEEECYDVGSYLFKRVKELGKQTFPIQHNKLYVHLEGASWAEDKQHVLDVYTNNVYNRLSNIDITRRFYY